MTSLPLVRTEYLNVSTGTVRSGSTAHGESLTDMESYLLPRAQSSNSALHLWGVADGLAVTAAPGATELTIAPGVALDAAGHLIALAADGFAIVDPTVDPTQVANVPIVPVTVAGVALSTTDLAGDRYLTVTFREVVNPSSVGNAPTLVHAPWLRLLPVADVPDTGDQVVLALVSLDAAAAVTALSAGVRRAAGVPASRLELRLPRTAAGPPLAVGQDAAGEVRLSPDGGLSLGVLPGAGPAVQVLTSDPAGGALGLLPAGGGVGVGLAGGQPQRTLHVQGSEIHSGGPGAGYSFGGRDTAAFVESPSNGERWVWYAAGGSARLWSGGDQLTVRPQPGGVQLAAGAGAGSTLQLPNPVDVESTTGLRQNRLHLSGDAGWSSLSYNASHDETNQTWVFPDPSRPAVTVEIDDNGGTPRFQVWSTTPGNTQQWQLRLAIDGNTGAVSVPADLSVGAAASFGGAVSVHTTRPNPNLVGSVNVTADSGTAVCAISQSGTAVSGLGRNGPGLWASGTPAGQFVGDVSVSGTLSAGAKQFVIDHPLDPDNRLLTHASVESCERLVAYSGNVDCDDRGGVTVRLPDWLEALATDFRYQLTCVGGHAPVYVSRPVRDNSFEIAGGTPGLTVSWQLTGVRQDRWAQLHDLVVEEDKPDRERGFYQHPEAFGKTMTASTHWARNEELVRAHPLLAQQAVRGHADSEARRVAAQEQRRQARSRQA